MIKLMIYYQFSGPFEVSKFSVRFLMTNRERGNEEIEVQRAADCVHFTLGGRRNAGRGNVPFPASGTARNTGWGTYPAV